MSPVHHYKNIEKKVSSAVLSKLSRLGGRVSAFFRRVSVVGKQRFTVMFIPHSEKKIFNFRISIFSMVFMGVLFIGILVAFFLSSTFFSGLSRSLAKKTDSLESTRASLEIIRDEIADLQKVSQKFEKTLTSTKGSLGLPGGRNPSASIASGGDLSSLFNLEEREDGVSHELSELKSISSFLSESVDSLRAINQLLVSQGDLLKELPTLWPLKGVHGRITTYFGPAEHPFTKQWYLHLGVDIAYRMGTPIIATADGKVVEQKYEPLGYGRYVVIRHKYGFYTKYGHMQTITVKEGENITQGQQIGTLGNTGLSTGPHLHYEVRIGSQVVDPERYLNIRTGSKIASNAD